MKFKKLSSDEVRDVAKEIKEKYGGDPIEYFNQHGQSAEEVLDGISKQGWQLHVNPEVLIVAAAAIGFELCRKAIFLMGDESVLITAKALFEHSSSTVPWDDLESHFQSAWIREAKSLLKDLQGGDDASG